MQRRNGAVGVRILKDVQRHIFVEEQLEPIEKFARRRLLLETRHFAQLVEDIHRLLDQRFLDAREVDIDD